MDIYSTEDLVDVIDTAYKPVNFLSNVFFPEIQTFDSEAIAFDRIKGARRLAPFVSPCLEGRPVRRNGRQTDSFSPAYIKPKMALTPCNSIKRMPGERIGGSMSLAQRRDMQIEMDMIEMIDMIDNRLEWMAAQAITFGYVDVVGDDYPLVRVDFQRNALNAVILAGINLWSASGTAKPVTNLTTWAAVVANNQGGSVTDVILGANVWAAMSTTTEFKEIYKVTQTPGGALPGILPTVMDNDQKIFHGQFGQFRLWSYNATYTDDAGNAQFYVPPNDVLLVAKQEMRGVQAFGAIMDHDALMAAKYFPKMWKQNDPSAIYTMVQSAPLLVPRNVDATFRATVL
ncbi:MAG TPA: major capsid protein [Polaromonas sp.]|uniref:major capsid protein n=1 Tax=Polaromonas sp. TaxID=1869339 RepID=UPI002D7020EE|nr:major capsid protein [Polaromonas sp.]HYW57685.1 major capsid protein [Polaromonas sp.]